MEDNRKERVANMDYEKELMRTDLTHTQRMFYRKMAKSQNLKGEWHILINKHLCALLNG